MPKDSVQRQIARKVNIEKILSGKYVRVDGDWEPNYIETPNNERISRVNLIGTVISNESDTLIIDDGTGKINVRTFGNPKLFEGIDLGTFVLLIARPREFGGEIFLIPEILKKITDPNWIVLRSLELGFTKKEPVAEEVIPEGLNDAEQVIALIEKLDKGEGVDIETIIEKKKDSEKIIESFLESGYIFEIKPGRVKVLK